jgi:hypothetical protein
MKKLKAFVVVVVFMFLILSACAKPNGMNDGNTFVDSTESLAGFIVIEDNVLYLDEAEVFIIGDEEDLLIQNIKSLDVAVIINDDEQMTKAGVNQSDMPNGYYIRRLSNEAIVFELTDETIYIFTDVNLLFITDSYSDRRYSTTNKDEFLQHLAIYYDPPNPPYVVFVNVRDGKVLSVTEVFLFTM